MQKIRIKKRLIVLLCPHSIFRMFSADRKRVETALENCNLPSGRVRLFSVIVFPLNLLSLVSVLLSLILDSDLSQLLHPSISLSPTIELILHSPLNSSWLLLCSFVWSLIFWMSAWLPTQNWFSLGCNETNRPSGSNRDDKSCFIFTSLTHR